MTPVQSTPKNVSVALKVAIKVQLDQYKKDEHLTTVTQPTDWMSNLVIVKKSDKLKFYIDPHSRQRVLGHQRLNKCAR